MSIRQYLKLIVIFFGVYLLHNDVGQIIQLNKNGNFNSIGQSGLLLLPLGTVVLTAILYVLVSNLKIDDDSLSQKNLLSGAIKFFGLTLLVFGLLAFVSGAFQFYEYFIIAEKTPPEHQAPIFYARSMISGLLKLIIAYMLIFKTAKVAVWLKVKGDS